MRLRGVVVKGRRRRLLTLPAMMRSHSNCISITKFNKMLIVIRRFAVNEGSQDSPSVSFSSSLPFYPLLSSLFILEVVVYSC